MLGGIAQPPRWALGSVVAAELAAFYAILNGNGWVFDDNLSMELARRDGFNHYWLASNLFGHFEPGHRAVYSLLAALMPIDARWGLVLQLVVLALSIVLLERSLRMILGGGWVPVVAAAYFGFSILLVPQLQWLSSGLEAIPTLASELLCVWAYLHFQRERRIRWVLVCGGALAIGLAFYEKPIFVVLYLVLIRLVLLPGRLRPRRAVRALAADWPIWLALGVVIAVYIAGREAFSAGSIASSGLAPLGEWVSLARVFWVQTLAPALFNFRLPAAGLSPAQVAGAVAVQIVLLALIVASVLRRRVAWRALVALGICVLATFAIVGEGRLATFGPSVGNDPRYLVEFAWLVPFMAALAWCVPARREDPGAREPGVSSVPRRGPGLLLAAIASLALASFALAGTFTSIRIQRDWLGSQARQWEANAEASLRALHRNRQRVVIVNNVVPWYIVDSAFQPYNRLSYVLPFYGEAVQVDGPLDGHLQTFTSTGRLQRAVLGKPLAASVPLTNKCASAAPAGATVRWVWPARAVPLTASAYLLITYDSTGRDGAPLYLDAGNGEGFGPYRVRRVGGRVRRVFVPPYADAALDPGAHTSIVWLGPASTTGVQLMLNPGTGVCVKRLALAQLQAPHAT